MQRCYSADNTTFNYFRNSNITDKLFLFLYHLWKIVRNSISVEFRPFSPEETSVAPGGGGRHYRVPKGKLHDNWSKISNFPGGSGIAPKGNVPHGSLLKINTDRYNCILVTISMDLFMRITTLADKCQQAVKLKRCSVLNTKKWKIK